MIHYKLMEKVVIDVLIFNRCLTISLIFCFIIPPGFFLEVFLHLIMQFPIVFLSCCIHSTIHSTSYVYFNWLFM